MATVKLTRATWVNHEASRVQGMLVCCPAMKEGMPATKLLEWIKYTSKGSIGADWTAQDIQDIRDKLVADGVIEIIQ